MRRKSLLLSLLLSLALLRGPVPSACALEAADYDGYIVKLTPEAGVLLSEEETPGGFFVIDSLSELQDVPEELVAYVEPNYLVELFAPEADGEDVPNDPLYASYQWGLQAIHAYRAALEGLTGAGVRVGFVDSGINRDHEDLNAGAIDGVSFYTDDAGNEAPFYQDDYGHGTFASGILAAQTDNGLGLAGIAPGVDLRMYRAFGGKTTTLAAVASSIHQAVRDGCQVLNLSLGLTSDTVTLRDAVAAAVDAGTVVTAAVGNSGTDALQYPAAYPGVIGVGSVGEGFTVSPFSQRNDSVDFTAPGEEIAGLSNTDPHGYKLALTSAANQGTSYAAPLVTGLAALALDYDPHLSPEDIFTLLKVSATDCGDPGYDTCYGYGVIDVERFLQALLQSYTIDLQCNGGALSEADSAVWTGSYKVLSDTFSLPIPEREGYVFTGWYEDAACTGQRYSEIPTGSAGDRTFYAGWRDAERFPARVYLAGYEAGGQMVSLEQVDPADWYDIIIPTSTGRTYRILVLDSLLRPTSLP